MKLFVIAVGKLKAAELRALSDDYLGRIRRYTGCEEREVRDAAGLASAIPKDAFVVALEVTGTAFTSEAFSRRIEQWASRHKGVVAFLIGGAEGIPPEVSARADAKLSLSTMTLPHRLARVLLLEQIYRALTILRGEPYARE